MLSEAPMPVKPASRKASMGLTGDRPARRAPAPALAATLGFLRRLVVLELVGGVEVVLPDLQPHRRQLVLPVEDGVLGPAREIGGHEAPGEELVEAQLVDEQRE